VTFSKKVNDMKTKLTIEQSQRLIELGVNPYLASNKVVEKHPITENELQYPIFTLSDLLSILPKEIEDEVDTYRLEMFWDANDTEWEAAYSEQKKSEVIEFFIAPELIDALYSLAVWLIENNLQQ